MGGVCERVVCVKGWCVWKGGVCGKVGCKVVCVQRVVWKGGLCGRVVCV